MAAHAGLDPLDDELHFFVEQGDGVFPADRPLHGQDRQDRDQDQEPAAGGQGHGEGDRAEAPTAGLGKVLSGWVFLNGFDHGLSSLWRPRPGTGPRLRLAVPSFAVTIRILCDTLSWPERFGKP
jgi:hypothetical protein